MKQSKNTGVIQLNFYRKNIKSQFSSLGFGKERTFIYERRDRYFIYEGIMPLLACQKETKML